MRQKRTCHDFDSSMIMQRAWRWTMEPIMFRWPWDVQKWNETIPRALRRLAPRSPGCFDILHVVSNASCSHSRLKHVQRTNMGKHVATTSPRVQHLIVADKMLSRVQTAHWKSRCDGQFRPEFFLLQLITPTPKCKPPMVQFPVMEEPEKHHRSRGRWRNWSGSADHWKGRVRTATSASKDVASTAIFIQQKMIRTKHINKTKSTMALDRALPTNCREEPQTKEIFTNLRANACSFSRQQKKIVHDRATTLQQSVMTSGSHCRVSSVTKMSNDIWAKSATEISSVGRLCRVAPTWITEKLENLRIFRYFQWILVQNEWTRK